MKIGRKKIAVFGVKTVPYTGGIENVVENTMPNISEFEIVVYVRKKYFNNEALANVKIICLSHLYGRTLEAFSHTLYAVFHALFIEKADIFFFHAVVLGLFTPIPKLFGKKVILQTHGLDWKREKWGKVSKTFIKFSTFLAGKIPDKTICVGEADKEFFSKTFGKEFDLIKNGVSIPAFSDADNFLIANKIEKNSYILFMSRLVPEKGAHLLIDAFLKLMKSNFFEKNIKLVIAGDTNYHDDYYYNLKKNKHERIIFTGFVSGDKKFTLLKNAICFVQPSSIEGMSTGILEAMYMGITPIVSNIKENLDLISKFGKSFIANDVQNLEQAIMEVFNNYDIYLRQREEMQNYIADNFSWESTISSLRTIFRDL